MSEDYLYQPSLEQHGIDFTPMGVTSMRDGIGIVRLGDDAALNARFFAEEVAIPAKSLNGITHYETMDYIEITKPSDKLFEIVRPARQKDKSRFREEWLLYKAGKEQNTGIPISALFDANLISHSQLKMLTEMKVTSVEKCVAATPHVVEAWGAEGVKIQKMAEGFLEYKRQMSGKGDLAKLKGDLEAKQADLQRKSDEMDLKLAEMNKKLMELEDLKSSKKGKVSKVDLSNSESVLSE